MLENIFFKTTYYGERSEKIVDKTPRRKYFVSHKKMLFH